MKTTLIIISVLILAFVVFQAFVYTSGDDIEQPDYKVLKEYEKFEIRQYKPVNYAYVKMPENSYKETSGKGFRMLADYIFGNNEQEKEIAMTSPVTMNFEDSTTMMFMVPSKYDIEEMPTPGNEEVKFMKEDKMTVAAIRFGGWANDKKIAKYAAELRQLLNENNIEHQENYSFLGYNAPYDLFNRRNEVIFKVNYP